METKEKEIMLMDLKQNTLYYGGLQSLETVGSQVACMVGKNLNEGHDFVWNCDSLSIMFSSRVERHESYMFIANMDDKTMITISVLARNVSVDVETMDGKDIKATVLARHAVADAAQLLMEHSVEIVEDFLDSSACL